MDLRLKCLLCTRGVFLTRVKNVRGDIHFENLKSCRDPGVCKIGLKTIDWIINTSKLTDPKRLENILDVRSQNIHYHYVYVT